MKLADVYFTEKVELGTWAQIGYNAPNSTSGANASSTNFTYTGAAEPKTGEATWTAANKVGLNDCGANTGSWTTTPTVSEGSVSWAAAVTGNNCEMLTPNFSNIGK